MFKGGFLTLKSLPFSRETGIMINNIEALSLLLVLQQLSGEGKEEFRELFFFFFLKALFTERVGGISPVNRTISQFHDRESGGGGRTEGTEVK